MRVRLARRRRLTTVTATDKVPSVVSLLSGTEGAVKSPNSTRVSLTLAVSAVIVLGSLVAPATASAASAPTIESESVSNIMQTNATLEADINPGGLETHYQFRLAYGCGFPGEACPQFCIYEQPCPGPWNSIITVPLPSGDLSAAIEVQHVSLDLNSVGVTLQPYKYRYSIEATNTEGTAQGAAQYFERAASPPPANLAPTIESESVSHVAEHDATLEAQIDPNGHETRYEFQIDTDGSYDYTRPACPLGACEAIIVGEPLPAGLVEPSPESIPASSGNQLVSLDLASIGAALQSGTTYHYRVIASNGGAPLVTGPDQTFTTPLQPPGPITHGAQSPGDVAQPSSAIQAPPVAAPLPRRKHHQRHKRGPHRSSLHRASRTG